MPFKIAEKTNFFESAIRNEMKNYIQRGKVDVFITYEDFTEANVCIKYNRDLAAEYMKYLKDMSEEFSLDNDVRVSSLARFPEVFAMEEQTIDEEKLWHALKEAQLDAFVKTLPDGVHTGIGERGIRLRAGSGSVSGLRRALYHDPEVLILDEATSNVDTRTEIRIQKAMRRLMAGKTCFVIAHRLSTIQNADQILVVNGGNIAESGTQ